MTAFSPAHAALFAPPARAGLFMFETTLEPIDEVAASYRARSPWPPAGAWTIGRSGPNDVFDAAALYDRPRLARLYGGRPIRVARGPIIENGRVTHTVLLLSPYPEPDLEHLNSGTLIMTVRVQ